MSGTGNKGRDIRPARLDPEEIAANFADLHPPLGPSEASIEADRCYFCYDAPCVAACPTAIDIPGFIQRIRSDNLPGAARTILSANVMGGMCARVCPTEVLCEQACVRNTHEDKPVEIGLLQRHAVDPAIVSGRRLFERGAATGRRVAVVGAGPAGLACAHRLARYGHDVVVYNRDEKPGGLNEYGIAAYKTVDDFARREVEYLLAIGGIELRNGVALGRDVTFAALRAQYDAVFLGFGLGGVNSLGLPGDDLDGVIDAVGYIARLRQAPDKSALPVGRRIVVIGGGMTAIDIAVQSRRLGAEEVTIAYRRGPAQMKASGFEQQVAQTSGVQIRHWLQPKRILGDAFVTGIEFDRVQPDGAGRLSATGETRAFAADVVFRAIGQRVAWGELGDADSVLETEKGRIVIDDNRRTSLPDVWAGGDCVLGGDDLTVWAVEDGKVAARAIHAFLAGNGGDAPPAGDENG